MIKSLEATATGNEFAAPVYHQFTAPVRSAKRKKHPKPLSRPSNKMKTLMDVPVMVLLSFLVRFWSPIHGDQPYMKYL
jgi:hypothetical protein